MKRLFLLPVIVYAACGMVLLSTCKEEKEDPLHFETTAPVAYTFPETETSATFTIASNTAWTVEVTEGRDRCSVTPASGKGSATVTVRVTANPDYLQAHTMALRLTAGNYTQDITVTQTAPPCPNFNPGAIATAGQTVTVGSTPGAIGSAQAATGGDGHITYQWYKNGNAIAGATEAAYTPPQEDAATVTTTTYTRRAKDNTCNTTLTPSTGSWVLTVVCPDFAPGAIATAGQTVTIGGTPATINSVQDATGTGVISYQWYKNGTAITGATEAYYTPPPADATIVGAHTYTRRAKDNTCSTTLILSEGSWVLTMICLDFNPGAIATTGQTIAVGGTPMTINSTQNAAGGDEQISYQWHKDGNAINGATAAYYTPLPADVTVLGEHIYTRHAKDNTCNTTFTPSEGTWVLTAICPGFNPGAIATTGQTINVNGTPNTINNLQYATGNGTISYQWYKNGNVINGATGVSYTPLAADAAVVGANTYTRRAKDNLCNTTLTPSVGSWVLTVICPFDAGAIATDGQTILVGSTPATINSVQNATGIGGISYQWYKNGTAISGATDAYYTPPQADAAVVGVNTYTRRAKDYLCNTTLTPSVGNWVLKVECPFDSGAIATDGQTILVGSAPATINSVQDATAGGTISYQWYKNGNVINGATGVSYTSPPADAAVAGAHTYTRRAKDNLCNTTLTPSMGSWVLTVVPCIFSAGAIATDGQTVCSGNAVNTITSSTDASGGDNNISYQWRRNGSTISGATAATYSPVAYNATVGAHTFTRWVHDGNCQKSWTPSAGSWVLTITAGTQLTLTTANNNQTINNGAAITPIQYITANASTVTYSGLPAGITGTWVSNTLTISGNSTATGTYPYAVAAIGIAGCINASTSGSIKIYPAGTDEYGCVSSNLTLGAVGFASTVTHVVSGAYGSQTWSAPVTAAYCEKTTYNGSTTDAYQSDCRNNTLVTYGHLFSWCMVKQYADQLCPDPWRVPNYEDYNTLNRNLAGGGAAVLIAVWGDYFGGSCGNHGNLDRQGSSATYWTSTQYDHDYSYYLSHNYTVVTVYRYDMSYGFQLRCVK